MDTVIYILISMDIRGINTCEVYSDMQVALGKASALTHFMSVNHPEWLTSPKEYTDSDGNRRWVFLNSSSSFVSVVVVSKKIKSPSVPREQHLSLEDLRAVVFQLPNATYDFKWAQDHYHQCTICHNMVDREREENPLYDYTKDVVNTATQAPTTSVPVDNPEESSLPAGWSYAGKPVIMQDLFEDPYSVLPTHQLKENQQWALTIARIRKRPQFSLLIPGVATFNQQTALHELQNKTNIGHEIVMLECVWLDRALNESKGEYDAELSGEDY